MKIVLFRKWFFALACCAVVTMVHGQTEASDSTGFDGDHFSLEGALDLFRQSADPESFEQRLNAENNEVNNLDLNMDGKVDYVRVVDYQEGDVHALVLQALVSESESQDVAVIELEKTGAESATLQVVGDADVYGQEQLVEPISAERAVGSGAPSIAVNVWLWPSVRFVYGPRYRPYVSPWRWGVYPRVWRPFAPRPLRVFRVGCRPLRAHYAVVSTRRVVRAPGIYRPHRVHSATVHTRTTTKVTGPRGRSATKTTRTTTVKGRHGGSVTRSKTKVRKGHH
jgi:hypothetical protein